MDPKAKILVVDDEPSILITLRAILEDEGYDVDVAETGSRAIAAVRRSHYDLVLTDLKMPDGDGLEVLAAVRKCSPHTVTIMMTGFGSLDSALEAVQLGAYEYLLKPTEVADLKLAVRRSLERKRLSEIDTLYRVNRAISGALDVEAIVEEISSAAKRVLNVAHASLITFTPELALETCSDGLRPLLQQRELVEALGAGQTVTRASGLAAGETWREQANVHDFCFAPGLSQGKLVCAVCAHHATEPYEFHASATRFLEALATQAALVLQNVAFIRELRRNNTELEAANRKLKELDELKSRFLSVATHELRTPLTVILGYNTMLAEALEDRLAPQEQETLRESVASCKRLIRLVNSMLDVSRIESGKMEMNLAPCDLRQLVTSVVRFMQPQANARNVALEASLPARLARVTLDSERIQQVLINLIGNALKFTPAGGRVTVAVRLRSDLHALELSISDTGIGIAKADQARIFEEFTQAHQNAGDVQGSGLGLAISRRIVQAHGGDVSVTSAPGQGSRFTVTLPLAKTKPRSMEHAMSA
jgi:signal transduction histidine kinase/DNA-binding response OmpR family regulator